MYTYLVSLGAGHYYQLGTWLFFAHEVSSSAPTPEDIFAEIDPTGCMFILMTLFINVHIILKDAKSYTDRLILSLTAYSPNINDF